MICFVYMYPVLLQVSDIYINKQDKKPSNTIQYDLHIVWLLDQSPEPAGNYILYSAIKGLNHRPRLCKISANEYQAKNVHSTQIYNPLLSHEQPIVQTTLKH